MDTMFCKNNVCAAPAPAVSGSAVVSIMPVSAIIITIIIAVKTPGELTRELCSRYADGIVTVSDDEIAMLDKPGQLREVSTIIASCGANVIQVRHDQGGEHADIIGCYLHVKMETRDFAQLEEIKCRLKNAGYTLV